MKEMENPFELIRKIIGEANSFLELYSELAILYNGAGALMQSGATNKMQRAGLLIAPIKMYLEARLELPDETDVNVIKNKMLGQIDSLILDYSQWLAEQENVEKEH